MKRSANVVDRCQVLVDPARVGERTPLRIRALIHRMKVFGVTARHAIDFACLGKLAPRIVARGIEQTIAHGRARRIRRQH